MEKAKKNSQRHQTQWAAQFAVASELCKRGYEVAFTLGHNTPIEDLMVISPKRKYHFLIDVKGLANANFWLIAHRKVRDDLFYILAHSPLGKPNHFFILTHAETNVLIDKHLRRNKLGKKWRAGFNFTNAYPYENCWSTLPQ